MKEKLFTIASIELPDGMGPADIIEYKGSTDRREFITGTVERVLEIRYSEEVHGTLDAIYANGVRFVPETDPPA